MFVLKENKKLIESQKLNIRIKLIKGAIKNRYWLDQDNFIVSLEKSFKASVKGWKRPIKKILLGPLRVWM